MTRLMLYRSCGLTAFYGLLSCAAVIAQLRGGIPIQAETGPIELAEIGFIVLLAGLCLTVILAAEVGAVWRWLAVATILFAASAVNDLVGFSETIPWIDPFDDISAILSWLGSAALVGAVFSLAGAPRGARTFLAVGFVLHLGTLFTDLAVDGGPYGRAAELVELLTYATYATALTMLVWAALSPATAAVVAAPRAPASRPFQDRSSRNWPLRTVQTCDLCFSRDLGEVVAASSKSCRIAMCNNCGLLFSSPMIDPAWLDRFFGDGFRGDPGAAGRLAHDDSLARKAAREEEVTREWALPLIAEHMDVRGKCILDIRSRTGSLARAMTAMGADVIGLDPLEANVAYAREIDEGVDIRFMPITAMAELRGFADESFDAVTELTVHMLGHLPSPRRHLERVFSVLRHGGLLFIDEKHALRPVKTVKPALFGNVPVHSYHFTDETLARYLEEAGFEVLECRLDHGRSSAFQHLRVAARKPVAKIARRRRPSLADEERIALRSEVAGAMRLLALRRPINRALRRHKRLLRKLPI